MATHSSNLAWKILWMEESGRPQSIESQRVGHNSVAEHAHTCIKLIHLPNAYYFLGFFGIFNLYKYIDILRTNRMSSFILSLLIHSFMTALHLQGCLCTFSCGA